MKPHLLVLPLLLLTAACAVNPAEIGREPAMTPVGHGLYVQTEPMPASFRSAERRTPNSIWDSRSADLFQDTRAKRTGDSLTVNILIDDKAQFDNASDRSRESRLSGGFDLGLEKNSTSHDVSGSGDLRSLSSSAGQGSIDRSERLRLSVAAVVTDVLPNGNLLITGSQEVRVNYEVRVLNIAGIVRPTDISKRNTIGYDKIAEARISYGGRGRVMEVQQPGWGQQVYDAVTPF